MEITLEQVERLREKANVSYAKAKEALEYSGGNLLDALIYLEEQGSVPRFEGGGYSTRSETPPQAEEVLVVQPKQEQSQKEPRSSGGIFRRIRYLLLDNELEIWRKDRPITALPVLILILLLVAAFWFTIPILVFGLFFGFRYRFSGPDLERDSINSVMDNVADTAADLGRQVMDELRSQHDKHKGKNDGR
ncbi:MAG: ubiquitin [Lawsonibacter sp.]